MLPTSESTVTHPSSQNEQTCQELAQELKAVSPQHPALSRVLNRLTASDGVETRITSYDRMHHRHNRS